MPQWKENPPGMEQKLLEQLFREGLIDFCDTPAKVWQKYPEFKDFSERVFSNHFRTTKAKFGGYAKTRDEYSNGGDDDGMIPGLGAIASVSSSFQSRPTTSSFSTRHDAGIQFKNAPYITWVYTDHVKSYDYVCVAIPIVSGSRDVDFSISEDGMSLHIKYVWPTALYYTEQLFKNCLAGDNKITMDHPKIHSFVSRMLECDLTKKSDPEGSIVISLPVKVMRDANTYTKSGVASNDSKILLLEFQAFQKAKIIEDADTSITFI